MTLFLTSLFVICLFFVLMAVGMIFAKKPIRGSCGGLNCVCKSSKEILDCKNTTVI